MHNLARLPLALQRELRDAEIRRAHALAEARYRSLFERVPVGVFSVAPDGRMLDGNPAMVAMLAMRSRHQLVRTNLKSLWVEEREYANWMALLARDGVAQNFEAQMRRADGGVIWCSQNVRAEYAGAQIVRYEGVAVDITSRKRAHNELMMARDAALETARLKSEFLANMSHEIRTPLNGVIGVAELLRETGLNDEQSEYAELIAHSADSLLTIVNAILDFSKLSAGKLAFERIDFELAPMVESVANLLSEPAAQKNLELIVEIDPELPTFVVGDPNRIRQVLTNLLGNALKFTHAGEVLMSVRLLGATSREVTVEFRIADTGIGIGAEAQRALFQPFFQADGSTTRKYGGTGLGLAISQHLVEGMGGRIEVQSELGKGSSFSFRVTLGRAESEAQRDNQKSAPSGLRVLIVDDNDTNRAILHRQLKKWRIAVSTAASGAEALETLRVNADDHPFDAAILDLAMPGMDGLRLARLIKTDPRIARTRLIMMSAIGGRGEADSRGVAIEGWLTKPVKQIVIFNALSALMVAADAAAAKPRPLAPHDPMHQARSRFRILLVEDNLVNQMVAKHQLLKLGYQVDALASGAETLDALDRYRYPLILMDCMMPDMDGYETTAEIRRREAVWGRHTPIVAMTANALEGDREKCLAAGMDDYLAKPVKLEEMTATLDRWLLGSASARAERTNAPAA